MKIIFLVVIFTISYVVCMDLVNKYMSSINFDKVESNNEVRASANVFSVSISGSVVNPGKYTVTKDSTLGYLITLAGGLSDNADVTSFNSSVILSNDSNYYIPYIRVDDNNNSIKVSINTSTEAALDTLPGIGEVFAKRIIEYRINNGFFKSIEDLKQVKGIGDSLFDSLKDLVCL